MQLANLTICLILLLPFERIPTANYFGFTIKPAYIVAIILVGLGLLNVLRRNIKFTLQKEDWIALSLAAWSLASTCWSINRQRSLIMSLLLTALIAVFILLRKAINHKLRAKIIEYIIYMGTALSIFTIIQFIAGSFFDNRIVLLSSNYGKDLFGFPRPQATFLEPLYLANFLLFPLFLCINNISKSAKMSASVFAGKNIYMLILMVCAFILTLSRGAYLALAVALLCYFTWSLALRIIDYKFLVKICVCGFASVIIALLLVFGVSGKSGVETFVNHAVKTSDLAPNNYLEELKNRNTTKRIALIKIKTNPILGIGLNAFGALPIFKPLREIGDWQTVNNQYLEITVELGIVGLILFLFFVWLVIKYFLDAVHNKKYDNIVYCAFFIALLVQYLTFSTIYLLYMWVFLAIIWPAEKREIITSRV